MKNDINNADRDRLEKEKLFREIRLQNLEKITAGFKYVRMFDHFKPSARILDIACGIGYNTIKLCTEDMKGIGLDIRLDLLAKGKKLSAISDCDAKFSVGRAEKLPFQEGVFDICLHLSSLEHIQKWKESLKEAHRVLKKGGLLHLATTNKLCPKQVEINNFPFYPWIPEKLKKPILEWIIKNRIDMVNYSPYPAINWFTYRGLSRELKEIGFRCLESLDLVNYKTISQKRKRIYPLLVIFKFLKPIRFIPHFFMGLKLFCIKD